jgi:WD40 repeat protein
MSPEQAAGHLDRLGSATDVYSLGATLYHLLTGRAPFADADAGAILQRVQRGDYLPPRRAKPELSAALEAVCLKAMALRPQDRYPSPRALAEDVEHWLADEPISAYPEGWRGRLGRWARRHRAWVQAGVLALLLVTAVAVVAALLVNDQRQLADGLALEKDKLAQAKGDLLKKARGAAAHLRFERAHTRCLYEGADEGLVLLADALGEAKEAGVGDVEESVRLHLAGWARGLHPLRAAFAQPAAAAAVAFSRDGKRLAAASGHRARVWDLATGKALPLELRHPEPVRAVAFSPDGATLLTAWGLSFLGEHRGGAQLWDLQTGKTLGKPFGGGKAVWAAAFSPDGTTVVTGGLDKAGRLWNRATGKELTLPHSDEVWAAAFSPDGHKVVTGSWDRTARVWEVSTGKSFGAPLRHGSAVLAVAFGPGGATVLTGTESGTAVLWDTATGQPLLRPPLRHRAAVQAVAFHPDGTSFLTASADGTVRLWDRGTARPLGPPLRHRDGVRAASFGPSGDLIATGSGWEGEERGEVRVWRTGADPSPRRVLRHTAAVEELAFTADSRLVLTRSANGARLWEAATGKEVALALPRGRSTVVAFSPDGRLLLTVAEGKLAQLWEVRTGNPLGPGISHAGPVRPVAFSPDGGILALGGWEKNGVRLWDVTAGKPLGGVLRLAEAATAVAVSPDGRSVLTGSRDETAQVWDVRTGKKSGAPLRHRGAVWAVAFSPDGRLIATASADRTARLWEAATGRPVGLPLAHDAAVQAVAFSRDGRLLLTGSADRTARLWEARSGRALGPPLRHRKGVTAVAFGPDGKRLGTASKDNAASLWEAPVPVAGDAAGIVLWAQVATALEVGEDGVVHVLDAGAWEERRQRLESLGGPPLP